MKLIYLIRTVLIAFSSNLLASIALDTDWIQKQISRQIIVYLFMILVFVVAFLVIKEILNDNIKTDNNGTKK